MPPVPTEGLPLPFDPTRYVVEGTARRYGLALVFFALSVVARLALDKFVPGQVQFLTFFPAEVVTAFLCGPLPAVMVVVLCAATGIWFLTPLPGETLGHEILTFVLFMADAGLDIVFIYFLMRALRRLKERDQQLLMINTELKHRIKNIFAITGSVCTQSIQEGMTIPNIRNAVTGRIMALSAAQNQLSFLANEGAQLRQLILKLVTPVSPAPERLQISGPEVRLPESASIPFALILHELATNALKYGAWSDEKGRVALDWCVNENEGRKQQLDFSWRERDGPQTTPPTRFGLGSVLIQKGLGNAKVDYNLDPGGLYCRIGLPL